MNRVVVLGDAFSMSHRNGYNHPENPRRISALLHAINDKGIPLVAAERGRDVQPQLVHTERYLESLRSAIARLPQGRDGGGEYYLVALDEDTYACRDSLDVAYAGLALEEQAVDMLMVDRACRGSIPFVITRPPGHHARADGAMGFCIFNNAAYAARYAQRSYGKQRVAIVDWDVHHGNGTEEIFYDDSSVLTVSIHAFPFWPDGCGMAELRGGGSNLNLPMPLEGGDLQYIEYTDKYLIPSLERFEPELIIVAAGFDAHCLERNSALETKSLMSLTENGFSYMTHELVDLARRLCGSRILFTLEGGYNRPSLVSGVESVLDTVAAGHRLSYPGFTTGAGMDMERYRSYCNQIEAVF